MRDVRGTIFPAQERLIFPRRGRSDGPFLNHWPAVSVLQTSFLLQIPSGFDHIVRPTEITPKIFIGPKGEDFFAVGRKMQIGGDDGENAFFNDQGKEARRNNVDSRKSQALHLL